MDTQTLAGPQTLRAELAHTIGADAAALESSRTSLPMDMSQGGRITVLPRMGVEGGSAKLVVDGRPRFEAKSVLGTGGFGEVTLAQDNDIDRKVALKRLHPHASDPGTIARFADEVRTMGQLDHPNIVPLHDVGLDPDGRFFYVMKYIEGETLESVLEHLEAGDAAYHTAYPFERRVEIFHGVLRAIQYAHARGVLHRDIKPANVMIGRYGEVLVMDWGISRRLDAPMARPDVLTFDTPAGSSEVATQDPGRTAEGALIGTPWYMSPEQAMGQPLDERSDVYALSVMFHEMMTLKHYLHDRNNVPAVIDGVLHVEVPFAASVDRAPGQGPVPAEYAHFIKHGVSKKPKERFRSVTAMLCRLDAIRNGEIPVECPVTFMKRANQESMKKIDRHPWLAIMTVLSVAACVLATVSVALVHFWLG